MIVAYTKTAVKGIKRKFGSGNSSGINGVLKVDQVRRAHVPEFESPFTLCGQRIDHLAEVEDDAQIIPCGTCKSRLEAIQRKHPERIERLLGNKLLPAPNM